MRNKMKNTQMSLLLLIWSDEKDDNTERLDEKKEAKGPGVTPTIDMEKCVDDYEDESTERLDE